MWGEKNNLYRVEEPTKELKPRRRLVSCDHEMAVGRTYGEIEADVVCRA